MLPSAPPIPTGQEVEFVAVAMATNDGHSWLSLNLDDAQRYRRLANTAIMRMGVGAEHVGSRILLKKLDRLIDTIRDAARDLDGGDEKAVKSLYVSATEISGIKAALVGDEDPDNGEEF